MQTFSHRTYWTTQQKPEGVFRIHSIGDSMTFGAGVFETQSYSAVLQEFLNRFAWNHVVEVINDGQSGYSIHDYRIMMQFQDLGFDPDMFLVSICNNDAELAQSKDGQYMEHHRYNLSPTGEAYPAFVNSMTTLRDHAAKLGVPLVVMFTSICGEHTDERRFATQIGNLCKRLEIDFIDISQEFRGQRSSDRNPKMYVSQADQHPSVSSHRDIAMRLARHIMSRGYLGKPGDEQLTEPELYEKAIRAAQSMCSLGKPAPVSCEYLLQVLESKRQSRARLRIAETDLVPDDEYRQLRKGLQDEQALLARLAFRQGYAQFLDDTPYRVLNGLRRALERTDRQLIILEQPKLTEWLEDQFNQLSEKGVRNGPGNPIDTVITGCGQKAEAFTAALESLEHDRQGFMRDGVFLPYFRYGMDQAAATTARQWHECRTMLTLCGSHAKRIAALYPQYTGQGQSSFGITGLALVQSHVDGIFAYLDEIAGNLHIPLLGHPPIQPKGNHSRLRITITTKANDGTSITVIQHTPNKADFPVSDMHHLIRDHGKRAYDFMLPYIPNADIILQSQPAVDANHTLESLIDSIEVSTPTGETLTFGPNELELESPTRGWLRLRLLK